MQGKTVCHDLPALEAREALELLPPPTAPEPDADADEVGVAEADSEAEADADSDAEVGSVPAALDEAELETAAAVMRK